MNDGFAKHDSSRTGISFCTHRCLQLSERTSASRHPTICSGGRHLGWLLPGKGPMRPLAALMGPAVDSSLRRHGLPSFSWLLPYLCFLQPLSLLPEGFNPSVGREYIRSMCDSQLPWEPQRKQAAPKLLSSTAPPMASHIRSHPHRQMGK